MTRRPDSWFPLSLALAAACPSLPCDAAGGGGPARHGPWVPRTPAGEALRVVVEAPAGGRHAHLGWPKLVRATDGTLVLGCLAGRQHTVDGCPAVCLSHDGGKSFGPLRYLAEFDQSMPYKHSGNISLGVAADGSLVYLAMAFTGDKRNTIYGWRSTDSGATWQVVDTSRLADNRSGSVFGEIFPIPDLGLVTFGHYRVGSIRTQGIWYAVSPDHGHTWGTPICISERKLFEPAFTFASGRLVGLIRNDPGTHYWQLISADLGKTWQDGESPVGHGQRGLPSPFIAHPKGNPNRLLALLTHRSYGEEELGYVELWEADSAKLDWRPVRKLVTVPRPAENADLRPDFGYPWMTQLSETEWLLVLYCGHFAGPNSLWGVNVTIE